MIFKRRLRGFDLNYSQFFYLFLHIFTQHVGVVFEVIATLLLCFVGN